MESEGLPARTFTSSASSRRYVGSQTKFLLEFSSCQLRVAARRGETLAMLYPWTVTLKTTPRRSVNGWPVCDKKMVVLQLLVDSTRR
jgi:hypothetical protein